MAPAYPTTGPCDYCGHKNGHLIPGGSYACEACFYTLDEGDADDH